MTLRELAEKATPGPWKKTEGRYGEADVLTADGSRYVAHDHEGLAMACSEADAAYIAAVSPDVVLALLDRLDALEKVAVAVDALMYRGLEERGPDGRYPAHAGGDRDGHNILIPLRYPDGHPTDLWNNLVTAHRRAALTAEVAE